VPKPEKVQLVQELKEKLEKATMTVSVSFSGITVAEINQLRHRLRQAGMEYRVVKNTLLRLAAQQAHKEEIVRVVEGPTAVIFTYGDPVETAKVLEENLRGAPAGLVVRGAIMDGTVLGPEALRELAQLPPRSQLLAELLGQLQGPMASLLAVLEWPFTELVSLLEGLLSQLPSLIAARMRQLEERTS